MVKVKRWNGLVVRFKWLMEKQIIEKESSEKDQ